ncbi:outer membrane protein [Azoarcus sp. CIB]|uniref:MipA/OmpV family protein n=1 Tax=Aromatoleum sp. (strain CIB) TaxID=198107 RepID=UPI00067D6ADF|nr:MipA/OmpV family protein [Azoarcus sp. CIB]AKU11811.1 outer membrane protein [Azoarcus sp. CIB]
MRAADAGAESGLLRRGVLAVLLAPAFVPAAAPAAEKPLWELGAGLTVLQFPAYRGSDEDRLFVLPVPYVVYRGEFLKADRQGIRGTFFDSDRVELNLSLGASPPVSSDRVKAREGMPDLKPTVEIGPSLDVQLWRSADERLRLRTRLPLRAGFTVEGSPESTGWQFTPQLNLDWRDPAGLNGWTLGLVAGPVYGDRRQHRYFYTVEANEATPLRPAYDARGGYGGTQVLAALWKRYPGWWIGGFVRYDSLAGAVFEDSPLVKRKDYVAAGFAVTWVLGESTRRVDADE